MTMRLRTLLSAILAVAVVASGWSQDDTPIKLTNPSFEDIPRHSHTPRGWYDCGFPGESPPDTQPDPTFQVSKSAESGDTYLGLVVRDNDTWEAVSQKISRPMDKNQCYEFTIQLARSESYISVSRITDEQANYVTPAKLRVYGGYDYCDKRYLLGETKLVINTRWIEYKMKFEPIDNYTHITMEAFYNTPTLFPYNGNLLADNASDLVPVPCSEEEILAEEETPEPAREEVVAEKGPETKPTPEPAATTPPTEEAPKVIENKKISELSRSELREGSTIRLDNLYFAVNKAIITDESNEELDEIFALLRRTPDLVVEIGGHTNGLCDASYCNKLSTDRAKAVYEYLIAKGISRSRITYKGYGKTEPVATNSTADGRNKNQRVDVKVLGYRKG